MVNIKKVNSNDIDGFEIRESMDELRDRLSFLGYVTTALISSGEAPSDRIVCGMSHVFDDCKKVAERVEVMAGGKV